MANTPAPIRRIYTPEQVAAAQARADEQRAEIHAEGVKQGHKHAIHSELHRLIAAALVGIIIGGICGGIFVNSLNRDAMFNSGAVIDRALARTLPEPSEALPPAPATRDPSTEYRANTRAARGNCTEEQLRIGLRHCGLEPPSAR